MAGETPPTNARTPIPQPDRSAVRSPSGRSLAPQQNLADSLAPDRIFDLEPGDYDGIRDATRRHVAHAAQAFGTALSRKAL